MAGALRELIELLLTEIAISGTDGKNCFHFLSFLPEALLPSLFSKLPALLPVTASHSPAITCLCDIIVDIPFFLPAISYHTHIRIFFSIVTGMR